MTRLHRDLIQFTCEITLNTPAGRNHQRAYLTDYTVCLEIARLGQTVLFSSEQALALRPALERFSERADYRLPWPFVIVQFDRPIRETEFFEIEPGKEHIADADTLRLCLDAWEAKGFRFPDWTPADGDAVTDLLLGQQADDAGIVHNQAVAYFVTGAIQRVYWRGTELIFQPGARDGMTDQAEHNKVQLRNLAHAIAAYLNAENMILARQDPPEKVNAKRRRAGRPEIQPYYVCRLRGVKYAAGEAEGIGRHVGYRFDVRGHFRQLPDGRLTWVRPHQRGLQHDFYRPKVYDARSEEPPVE